MPEGIEAVESFGPFEEGTARPVYWDREAKSEGHRFGRRRFKDTNEFCDNTCYYRHNDALFEHMKAIEQAAGVWVEDSEG